MTDAPQTIQLNQPWPIKAFLISFLLGAVCAVWFFPPEPVTVMLGCEHINELIVSDDPWYAWPSTFWN